MFVRNCASLQRETLERDSVAESESKTCESERKQRKQKLVTSPAPWSHELSNETESTAVVMTAREKQPLKGDCTAESANNSLWFYYKRDRGGRRGAKTYAEHSKHSESAWKHPLKL